MSIPSNLVRATPDFIAWCVESADTIRVLKNTRGRYFQGSVNKMDESEYTKVVEVPDGLDEDGNPKSRLERQTAETFREFLGGRPAFSFLPGRVIDLRVNRYEAPDGEGWFITAAVEVGGETYTYSYDGDGPSDYGHDWEMVE